MDLSDAYTEIAERSMQASEAALSEGLQESSGFLVYHAFESIGGALCYAKNRSYALTPNHMKRN
jgi:hypothetical protein